MGWLIWSNGSEYGCCKNWNGSQKAILALLENGFEVWGIDFKDTDAGGTQPLNLKQLEKWAILKALNSNKWSQLKAAKILGISPRNINYKIQKHGIVNAESGNGKSTWTKNI